MGQETKSEKYSEFTTNPTRGHYLYMADCYDNMQEGFAHEIIYEARHQLAAKLRALADDIVRDKLNHVYNSCARYAQEIGII